MDFATLKLVGDTTGLKPVAPALDAVVAKAGKAEAAVKKLGTSTTTMGTGARKAAADTQAVSAALDRIEADAQQATVALNNAKTALNGVGMQSNAAAGQVGNLTAQVFDISMMMQAGQNPFQLMLQQGSQVAQVMGPMGAAGAVAALKSVFVQLLNPVNLAVFAIIGGTAALVQWATASGDAEAETDAMTAAIDRQKAIVEELTGVYDSLVLARQMYMSGAETDAEQRAMNELVALAAERNVLQGQLEELQRQSNANIDSFNTLAEDAVRLKIQENEANAAAAQGILNNINLEQERAAAIERAKEFAELFKSVQDTLGQGDFSGPWNALLPAIQRAINKANEYRIAAALAGPGKLAREGDDGRGSQRETSAGANTREVNQPWLDTYDRGGWIDLPDGAKGKGGGGGSRSQAATEAEKEAEAIQKVVDSLKSEIELVGATTEARRLQQELQKAGVTIYSEEGQAIAALVEELTQLEAQQKLVDETMKGIESAANGFFTSVLSGAKSAKDALGDLLKQLGDLFLNQAFKMLWGGSAAGGTGKGVGGFFAGLFDAGGRIPAGALGIVAEKRPEFVDGKLVTSPTLMEGPANVTGGASTAKLLNSAPGMQVAMRRPAQQMQMPAPRVTVQPPQVVVLDDPRKIDAWARSPAGERSAARQQRRLGNG